MLGAFTRDISKGPLGQVLLYTFFEKKTDFM